MVAISQPCLDTFSMECMATCRNLSNTLTLHKLSKADSAVCGDESSTSMKSRCGSFDKGGEGTSSTLACSGCAEQHFFQQKWMIPSKRMTTPTTPPSPESQWCHCSALTQKS